MKRNDLTRINVIIYITISTFTSVCPCVCITPHLTGKKLSTNSPWDFEYVFETMDDY